MMLLGDVLLCPPVVAAPREKAPLWVSCLRKTTQVDHGAVAFAAAMRPSIEMASALPSGKSAVVPTTEVPASFVHLVGQRKRHRRRGDVRL